MKMSQFYKLLFGSTLLAAAIGSAYADSNPTTFLGPTVRGTYTGWLSPISGYSVLGEAGVRNYRLNITTGSMLDDYSRLKFSAEYLTQNIQYNFLLNNSRRWVHQYAVGGQYDYGICADFSCFVNLNAYASYAPSKDLNPVSQFFSLSDGSTTLVTDNRRIAGSNAYGVSPGFDLAVWQGGSAGLALNYDHVRYNQKYSSDEVVSGLGGTARFNQLIMNNINIGLLAAVRKPFNNYEVDVNWLNALYNGRLGVGLFGAYTDGKEELPNTWNAGVSLNFTDCAFAPVIVKAVNYKNEVGNELCIGSAQYAVVMNSYTPPQVLAHRPAQLGAKLPIVNATFSGGVRS